MNYILLPLKNWLQNWTNIIFKPNEKVFIMTLKIYALLALISRRIMRVPVLIMLPAVPLSFLN